MVFGGKYSGILGKYGGSLGFTWVHLSSLGFAWVYLGILEDLGDPHHKVGILEMAQTKI